MVRFDSLLALLREHHISELQEVKTRLEEYEDIERDRLEHIVRGRVDVDRIDKVVLHGTFSKCTKCKEIKPMSQFGMLTDKTRREIRNQPQCRICRKG